MSDEMVATKTVTFRITQKTVWEVHKSTNYGGPFGGGGGIDFTALGIFGDKESAQRFASYLAASA